MAEGGRKMSSGPGVLRKSEKAVCLQLRKLLERAIGDRYVVSVGKSLLYNIEVDAFGRVTPDRVDSPARGQFAFQTDLLIEKQSPAIPLVVLELKSGAFSSHDVITYSSKASRHKSVYPYLRYGFLVVGIDALGRRFVTHNQGFDFAMAVTNVASQTRAILSVVRNQIESAERIVRLMQTDRIKITRYEETVRLGGP